VAADFQAAAGDAGYEVSWRQRAWSARAAP
jgi:hypothetical protein